MTDDDLGKLWNVARYQGSWDAFVETSRALESRVLAEGKREAVADCKCRRTGDWKGFHHPLCDANWSDEQEPKLWVAFSQSGQVMAYSSVEPHQSDGMMYS
jgi:uncharacterized OB-fold protein